MSRVETVLQDLARAGAPSVVAPPYLAERVLAARRRRGWRRGGVTLLAGGVLVAGVLGARSPGEHRFFEQYQPSADMAPTIAIGAYLQADRTLAPEHGDVVVVDLSADGQSFRASKRVIGLPGDVVACPAGSGGTCEAWTVNGAPLVEPYVIRDSDVHAPVRVPAGELYLLGDNRPASNDSRYLGTTRLSDVVGVGVGVRGRAGPLPGAPAHEGASGSVDPAGGPPTAPAVRVN